MLSIFTHEEKHTWIHSFNHSPFCLFILTVLCWIAKCWWTPSIHPQCFHSFTYFSIDWLILPHAFIHSSTNSFIWLSLLPWVPIFNDFSFLPYIHSIIYSFIYSYVKIFKCSSFIHSFIHMSKYSFLLRSRFHWLFHSLIRSLIYSFIHSFIHTLFDSNFHTSFIHPSIH